MSASLIGLALFWRLTELCVTWASRGPVNACIDWQWTTGWGAVPW